MVCLQSGAQLQNRCSIITPPTFKKIALQEASLEELSKIQYLSYAEAPIIVRFKDRIKGNAFF